MYLYLTDDSLLLNSHAIFRHAVTNTNVDATIAYTSSQTQSLCDRWKNLVIKNWLSTTSRAVKLIAVQGHPRLSTFVPIEYATSY